MKRVEWEEGRECSLWANRLEAELARELGQPVTLTVGGEPPGTAPALIAALVLPGARLTLAAHPGEIAGILVAGRVIAAGEGDATTVGELWNGILASVAARLQGQLEAAGGSGASAPYSLRLGEVTARLLLTVESTQEARDPAPAVKERAETARGPYDLLLEVELDAQVRFGSREMELKELLELGPGDVVELDRNVTDPVDLIVGGRIVARGEVVLVDGNFGLRVIEVAEPVRRLESIRCMA